MFTNCGDYSVRTRTEAMGNRLGWNGTSLRSPPVIDFRCKHPAPGPAERPCITSGAPESRERRLAHALLGSRAEIINPVVKSAFGHDNSRPEKAAKSFHRRLVVLHDNSDLHI